MQWNVNSLSDLEENESRFLTARRRSQFDEQVSMFKFLECFAKCGAIAFPITIRHTWKEIPDFQIGSPKGRIAVELAKLASPNAEKARDLQNKRLRTTLRVAEFMKDEKDLPIKEIASRGFLITQKMYAPTLEELNEFWWKQFLKMVQRKFEISKQDQFQHGDEDWLILWDRLFTPEHAWQTRLERVSDWLLLNSKKGSFKKVFIQEHHFKWQVMFSENSSPKWVPQVFK